MSLIKNFNTLFYEYNKLANKKGNEEDISLSALQYVMAIYDFTDVTVTKLSKILGIKKSSVTQMIDNLLKNDYVTKIDNPNDNRSSFIKLTEKGIKVMELEDEIYTQFIDNIGAILSKEEYSQLEYIMAKIANEVKNNADY